MHLATLHEGAQVPLPSPGQLGDAHPGLQASGHWMAGRLGRHRLVQQHRLVRRLPLARCRRSPPESLPASASLPPPPPTNKLAETFFAMRARPNLRLISVGSASSGPYISRQGLRGSREPSAVARTLRAWHIHPPKRNSRQRSWPKRLRRWLAGIRQIVETCLRQALQHLRSLAGAASRHHRFAGTSGIEGSSAQLLHLAQ